MKHAFAFACLSCLAGSITADNSELSLANSVKPSPIPIELQPFVGEYGWADSSIVILEDLGSLCALIDWSRRYHLTGENDTTFRIITSGFDSFDGKLTFVREHNRNGTYLVINGQHYPRRLIPGVNGP